MNSGSSNLVRQIALDNYVRPAASAGKGRFQIAVKDVMKDLQVVGFPPANYHQICTSLKTRKFLRENSLEIESIEGPRSGSSPTVVYHYRRISDGLGQAESAASSDVGMPEEEAAAKAKRLTDTLLGLFSEELAEYGGGEAFLRWIRSEEDTDGDVNRNGTNTESAA